MDDGGKPDDLGYVSGQSTRGFIYFNDGRQRFFPLWAGAAEYPDFFPADANCTICDAKEGLLLCHFRTPAPPPSFDGKREYNKWETKIDRHITYVVLNPFLPNCTRNIPSVFLPRKHDDLSIPPLLLVDTGLTERPFRAFEVLCAIRSTVDTDQYSFHIYSSVTKNWKPSAHHKIVGGSRERIREDTGVSCRRVAFWLIHNKPEAVSYDAVADTVRIIRLPDAYTTIFRQPGTPRPRSQLGMHGERLCFVAGKGIWHSVYEHGDEASAEHGKHRDGDAEWDEHGDFDAERNEHGDGDAGDADAEWVPRMERTSPFSCGQDPDLPRFQNKKLQVPFWFQDTLMIWDQSGGGTEGSGRSVMLPGPQRDAGTAVLPLVYSRLDPTGDFPLLRRRRRS